MLTWRFERKTLRNCPRKFSSIRYKEGYTSDFYEDNIRKELKFMIASRRLKSIGSSYNHYFGMMNDEFVDEQVVDSLAYCRGDLGVILLFNKASEILKDDSYSIIC